MEKHCIFCGERPLSKTKEHVLPRWLLKITGDPKRALNIEFTGGSRDTEIRGIPFDALHFPACSDCNNVFNKTEEKARVVVEKILQRTSLSAIDFDVLLRWLDKIRIGLWLGFLSLSKNPFNISPRFHITKRISTKDRAVIIYRADDQEKGLAFHGANTPSFHHMPSCFTLIINDFYLFNISTEFLFARRLGFPYPSNSFYKPEGLNAYIVAGRERIMHPPVRLPFSEGGTEIYQTMFLNEAFHDDPQVYNTPYVREMSMDWENGVGWPMLIRDHRLIKASPELSLEWFPRSAQIRANLHTQTMRQTLKIQADLWDYLYINTDKNMRDVVKKCQRINKALGGEDTIGTPLHRVV